MRHAAIRSVLLGLLLGTTVLATVQNRSWADDAPWEITGVGVELAEGAVDVHVGLARQESGDALLMPATGVTGLGHYFFSEEDAGEYLESLALNTPDAPQGPWDAEGWLVHQDFSAMTQQRAPMPGESMVRDVETLVLRAGNVVWEMSLWDQEGVEPRRELMSAALALFAMRETLVRAVVIVPVEAVGQGEDLGLEEEAWDLRTVNASHARDLTLHYDSSQPVPITVRYKGVLADFTPGEVRLTEDAGYELVEAVVDLGAAPETTPVTEDGVVAASVDSLKRFRAVTFALRSRAGSRASVFGPLVRIALRDEANPWSPPRIVHPDDDQGWTDAVLTHVQHFFCRDNGTFATMLDEDGRPDCNYRISGHGALAAVLHVEGRDGERVFTELVRESREYFPSGDALDNEVELFLHMRAAGLAASGEEADLSALLENRLAWPHHREEFLEPGMWSAQTARAVLNDLALFEAAGAPQEHEAVALEHARELSAMVLSGNGPVAYVIGKDTTATIHPDESPLPLALAALACMKAQELFNESTFVDAAMAMLDRLSDGHAVLTLAAGDPEQEDRPWQDSEIMGLVLAAKALKLGGDSLNDDGLFRAGENLRLSLLGLWDRDQGGVPMLARNGDGSCRVLPWRSLDDQIAMLGLARNDLSPWW